MTSFDSVVLVTAFVCLLLAQLSVWRASRILRDAKNLLDRAKKFHDLIRG